MKNIHVLPTDKPSRLSVRLETNEFMYSYKEFVNQKCEGIFFNQNQHIYITSEEKIREKDWVLYTNPNSKKTFVVKCTEISNTWFDYERLTLDIRQTPIKWAKKIILTTDPDLITKGIQIISDEFLKWLVANQSSEKVNVIRGTPRINSEGEEIGFPDMTKYKIIIPSAQSKSPHSFYEGLEESACKALGYELQTWLDVFSKDPTTQIYTEVINWCKGAEWQRNQSACEDTSVEIKKNIVGYRVKPHINRRMIDGVLEYSMPFWNANDKSVYFIRGHVAGCLVARLRELQVLDAWLTPIYENEEIESDWVQPHHVEHYFKEGTMSD